MSRGEQLQNALNDAEFRRTEIENHLDECVDKLSDIVRGFNPIWNNELYRLCFDIVDTCEARKAVDSEIGRLLDEES